MSDIQRMIANMESHRRGNSEAYQNLGQILARMHEADKRTEGQFNEKSEEDQIEDSFARAEQEMDK